MLVDGKKITMTPDEWAQFQEMTFAPWRPRTIGEFNAMCRLAYERFLAESKDGLGVLDALAAEAMMFGENGEQNFPQDKRKLDYAKVHGTWPTAEQLAAFVGAGGVGPGGGLVRIK